jgi:excinuclease ABC subunit C
MNFSVLNQIPGVGAARRKMLINHFTSIEEIKNADIEQLAKVEGISLKTAKEIYDYFRS